MYDFQKWKIINRKTKLSEISKDENHENRENCQTDENYENGPKSIDWQKWSLINRITIMTEIFKLNGKTTRYCTNYVKIAKPVQIKQIQKQYTDRNGH